MAATRWKLPLGVLVAVFLTLALLRLPGPCRADDELEGDDIRIDASPAGQGRSASASTDGEAIAREAEAIKLDGLNAAQMAELRERGEKKHFQAEVSRMMKLIINSLYRNKEIFLRELISNASDALDKIRVLSLTDGDALRATDELAIRIKTDKEAGMLHITDTGVGMTRAELIANLGTIAKSGTAEFLAKAAAGEVPAGGDGKTSDMSDLIGQFGVGFYSAFLVADTVIVTSKSNDEPTQHIWESDASAFSVVEDPRGDTLKRGTTISLKLKPEALDYLQEDTIKQLVEKYSQFINFPIYLWQSRVESVEEPVEGADATPAEEAERQAAEEKPADDEDAEVKVEEEKEPAKPKTRKVDKTIWEWMLVNQAKPIWTRKPADITDDEYAEFYKAITKDHQDALAKTHFVAEGEVTFKSLLFVPRVQPSESFNRYGTKTDHIKLYVRRVFITDDFQDMMPNYLSFVRGVVDSDDLPLNVSRENLQQHKLLKVIKKKLVRKTLDMLKKISEEDYLKFWAEYSTNVKLGVIEDTANRSRLAKLLRFASSAATSADANPTSLSEYVSRMKAGQPAIYYIAAANHAEAAASPFVERLLKKGYEVLYLVDAVDEYCLSALPDFDGKKFQNVAKDGLKMDGEDGARAEATASEFKPLTEWLEKTALKDEIAKAVVSSRLHDSPCALVASQFGWTGNMERLAKSNAHAKSKDVTRDYYLSQKKTLEINARHPLVKELLRRVQADAEDERASSLARLLFETATLRSGFALQDTAAFAGRVEALLRQSIGVDADAPVDEEPEEEPTPVAGSTGSAEEEVDADAEGHDEL